MAKRKIPDLKIEPVPNRVTLSFLCIVEYRRENYLCVIDNITPTEIGAYVLDYAEQEDVPVDQLLSLVTHWFYAKSEQCPLSVEIARQGLTTALAPIYRTFDTTYVARIVGDAFTYTDMQKTKVRRRRVVPIPAGVEIRLRAKDAA